MPINPDILLFGAALATGIAVACALRVAIRMAEPVAALHGSITREARQAKRSELADQSALFRVTLVALPAATVVARRIPLGTTAESITERYQLAGWPGGLEDDELLGMGLLLGLVLVVPAVLVILMLKPIAAPLGLAAVLFGFGLVSAQLGSMATKRQRTIARTMPFVLDLLSLTTRAGASTRQAIQRVRLDYQNHPIGEEFAGVEADLDTGTTLSEAMKRLAERVPVAEIRTFSEDVVQSESLGQPLADTLERLSDRFRTKRVQDAQATAGKAKVMVLVPGMLVFVAVLELLFAPWIVRWFYGGFGGVM